MSVKILVDCRNPNKLPTVFANMETGFECISTSDFTEDIIRHAECYKHGYVPDVFRNVRLQHDAAVLSSENEEGA